jgi:hypothetical protein
MTNPSRLAAMRRAPQDDGGVFGHRQSSSFLTGKNCRVIMVNKTFLPGLRDPAQTHKPN